MRGPGTSQPPSPVPSAWGSVRKDKLGVTPVCAEFPALPIVGCVTLGKLLNLSGSLCPVSWMGSGEGSPGNTIGLRQCWAVWFLELRQSLVVPFSHPGLRQVGDEACQYPRHRMPNLVQGDHRARSQTGRREQPLEPSSEGAPGHRECPEQLPCVGEVGVVLLPAAPRAWAGRRQGAGTRQPTAQALWVMLIKAPSSQLNRELLKLTLTGITCEGRRDGLVNMQILIQ